MLITARRTAVTAMTAMTLIVGVAATPGRARADIFNPVNCSTSPHHPSCRVKVDKTGRPPGRTGGQQDSGRGAGSEQTPSDSDDVDDGCETILVGTDPPPGATGPGGWYSTLCTTAQGSSQTQPQWVPDGAVPAPDPAVLAQQAVSMLRLPEPGVRLSPTPPAPQVVNVPSWLWLDASTWGLRSATASVPGLSVTATATPTRVRWVTGDGATVTCSGPGTAWTAGMDPAAASPTCGHTYRTPSTDRPGGSYRVQVTVTWHVQWVGGGQSGVAGPLSTTASATTVVREAPAVNSGVPR